MIIGVGIDLIEQARVARALDRWGERLVAKLMGPQEAARLPPGPDRARAVALAIAAKEAASKALGTGWTRGVVWRDVVVDLGPPVSLPAAGQAAGSCESSFTARCPSMPSQALLLPGARRFS